MNRANNNQPALRDITNTFNAPPGSSNEVHRNKQRFCQASTSPRSPKSPSSRQNIHTPSNSPNVYQHASIHSRNVASTQKPMLKIEYRRASRYLREPEVGEMQLDETSPGAGSVWLITFVERVSRRSRDGKNKDFFRIGLEYLEDIRYEPIDRQLSQTEEAAHPEQSSQDSTHGHRLFLGEGDLSFADSFTTKHPKAAKRLTATTYEDESYLNRTYSQTGPANKRRLLERGAKVLHNVDATQIDGNQKLRSKYGDIHFNFPHDGRSYKESQTSKIIDKTFKSARKKLPKKGRIRMALVSKDKEGRPPAYYHGVLYKIAENSLNNGFKFIKKRKFDGERYPGYKHQLTTRGGESLEHVKKYGREYVFEKIDSDDEEEWYENTERFCTLPGEGDKKYLPEMETDSESSEDESSDKG